MLKGYVLSVVGVVIISQISEMIMPDGRMKETVRTIFLLITTLIFISPIVKIVGGNIDFEKYIMSTEIIPDENFINYTTEVRLNGVEKNVESVLQNNGYYGIDVEIFTYSEEEVAVIKNVDANLSNLVIIGEDEHINKSEIVQIIAKSLNVEDWRVSLSGK